MLTMIDEQKNEHNDDSNVVCDGGFLVAEIW